MHLLYENRSGAGSRPPLMRSTRTEQTKALSSCDRPSLHSPREVDREYAIDVTD